MTRKEAVKELRALAYEIYEKLEEMEDILKEVAPEELKRAEANWMSHIDGALLNLKAGGSLINLEDTLTTLEEEDEEE